MTRKGEDMKVYVLKKCNDYWYKAVSVFLKEKIDLFSKIELKQELLFSKSQYVIEEVDLIE